MWTIWAKLLPTIERTTVAGVPRTGTTQGDAAIAWAQTAAGVRGIMRLPKIYGRVL